MEFLIFVVWIGIVAAGSINKDRKGWSDMLKQNQATPNPLKDTLNDLFKKVDKSNTNLTNTVASGERRVVFSESQDKLKSMLYFTIFKFIFAAILIAILTVIYIQIIK